MNLDRLTTGSRGAASRPVTPGLTDAERARTIAVAAASARLGAHNVDHDVFRHAVMSDGSVLFLAPPNSPERIFSIARQLPAQTVDLTLHDLAAVPQTDRVRGSLTLRGPLELAPDVLPAELRRHLRGHDRARLQDDAPVLRLAPTRVWMRWSCEPETPGTPMSFDIPVDEYRAASPDPFFEQESSLLSHLFEGHRGLLRTLAVRADPDLGAVAKARPLALDRYGIVLRLYLGRGHHDRRVLFRRPVECLCELEQEFEALAHGLDLQVPDALG